MKIYLTEPGDPTVGIFPATFEVDCPFEQDTAHPEDLELFRRDVEGLFKSYDVPVKGMYDFEVEEMAQIEQESINFTCLEHIDEGKPRCRVQCPFCEII